MFFHTPKDNVQAHLYRLCGFEENSSGQFYAKEPWRVRLTDHELILARTLFGEVAFHLSARSLLQSRYPGEEKW